MKQLLKKMRYFLGDCLAYVGMHTKNLRVLIVAAMSIVSLLAMIIFSLLIFQKIQDIVVDNAVTNAQQVVNQTSATLDSYISDMYAISKVISEGLQEPYITAPELQDFLDTSQSMGSDIVSIALFEENGQVEFYAPSNYSLKEGASMQTQQWYSDTPVDKEFSLSTPHVQNLFQEQYVWVITLYTRIKLRGYDYLMAIDMNFSSIDEYCSKVNIGKRGYTFLVDGSGKIIYHPQQQMIYAGIKEEDVGFIMGKEDGAYIYSNDVVVVISSLGNVGWKTIGITYLQDTKETTNDIVRSMVIAYGAVLLIILVFTAVIARYISRPIGRIIQAMEHAEKDVFTGYVKEDSYEEVRRLSTAYNDMTQRILELMDQIKREQRELRKTEIRALHAQINPHFLYNTLDSILWMCEKGDNEGAVVMVSALGTLFRISLNRGKEIVTVREELAHAENYLRIQEVRYKNQFDYNIEVPYSLQDYKTPKILIQPFLENAIYHAFGRSVDKGMINIRVGIIQEKLLIEVEDNGVGMPPELVEEICRGGITSESGIGISNVHSRIQIYFGKEYGVEIHSVPDEGTRIRIWLPADITEDDIFE